MTAPSGQAITVFTDGACSGNPGPGGWGVVMLSGPHRKELSGGEADTTNNRMEMMAAISALEAIKHAGQVELHTDSVYLRDGITKWIHGWRRNGWRTADRKPVKNIDLWLRLETAVARHTVAWHWLKGHAGNLENERCDELARAALETFRKRPAAPGA